MAEDYCSFQLISGDGVLNMQGLENFTRTPNLSQRGLSYAVVAIMGPQSGGMYSFYIVAVVFCVFIAHQYHAEKEYRLFNLPSLVNREEHPLEQALSDKFQDDGCRRRKVRYSLICFTKEDSSLNLP
jgi:hypothetical protein